MWYCHKSDRTSITDKIMTQSMQEWPPCNVGATGSVGYGDLWLNQTDRTQVPFELRVGVENCPKIITDLQNTDIISLRGNSSFGRQNLWHRSPSSNSILPWALKPPRISQATDSNCTVRAPFHSSCILPNSCLKSQELLA